jgi:hypothetical protein
MLQVATGMQWALPQNFVCECCGLTRRMRRFGVVIARWQWQARVDAGPR